MPATPEDLFARFEELGIAHTTVAHAPVFTVEESQELRGILPGAHTKNLFLVDKDRRMVLVVAKEDNKVDLKSLSGKLGLGRFSFGKPELMLAVLGIEPGSVTPFGLINETSRDVTVVVDRALVDFAEVNAHPLRNSATTRLATDDLIRFIRACGHEPLILDVG